MARRRTPGQVRYQRPPRLIGHLSTPNPASFRDITKEFCRFNRFSRPNEGCLKAAEEAQWDLIVVDEAHKLSAYEYGTKTEESERYKAVKTVANKTDHLLFLYRRSWRRGE